MSPYRILLVDDDARVLRTLSRILERGGFAVETHDSGFGMTLLLRRFRPHVIVLDLNMPGLQGDAAMRAAYEVSNFEAMPKLLVVSGIGEDMLRSRSQALGASGYLCKPVRLDALVSKVSELCGPAAAVSDPERRSI